MIAGAREPLIVKVCGVTTPDDADACVSLGVDWIGLNFVAGSPRRVDAERARAIGDAVRGRAMLVGVVAGLDEGEIVALADDAWLELVQLHGDEPPELVRRLGALAYKALRIGSADDVAEAGRYGGLLLVDAKVPGMLGGTGKGVDLGLVAPLVRSRPVLIAGGLGPENVGAVVRATRPFGVDAASGVELGAGSAEGPARVKPGVKDLDRVAAFVAEARRAESARDADGDG